jgi:hypothetical protein
LYVKRKVKNEYFLDNIMEYDIVVDVKLDFLAFNIKKEVCNVLDFIFIF